MTTWLDEARRVIEAEHKAHKNVSRKALLAMAEAVAAASSVNARGERAVYGTVRRQDRTPGRLTEASGLSVRTALRATAAMQDMGLLTQTGTLNKECSVDGVRRRYTWRATVPVAVPQWADELAALFPADRPLEAYGEPVQFDCVPATAGWIAAAQADTNTAAA